MNPVLQDILSELLKYNTWQEESITPNFTNEDLGRVSDNHIFIGGEVDFILDNLGGEVRYLTDQDVDLPAFVSAVGAIKAQFDMHEPDIADPQSDGNYYFSFDAQCLVIVGTVSLIIIKESDHASVQY